MKNKNQSKKEDNFLNKLYFIIFTEIIKKHTMKNFAMFTIFAALISFSSCEEEVPTVLGCTDINATNYNSSATQNDGSCVYIIPGCTDDTASNYNSSANQDDGTCEYTWAGTYDASEDCNGGWTWEQVITSNGDEITLVNAFDWGPDITVPINGSSFSVTNIDGVIVSTDADGVQSEIQVVYTLISGEINGDSITMQYNISQLDENGELNETSDCQPEMTISTGGFRYSSEKKKL